MEWWKKLFAIIAGSIGWSSVELLMAWIFNVPVEITLFCGFMARVSFGEAFARNFTEKGEIGKRLRLHLGADTLLLPQGFLIMIPSVLTVSVALAGIAVGSGLVWWDELLVYRKRLLAENAHSAKGLPPPKTELVKQLRELDQEIEEKQMIRVRVANELAMKAGYRGDEATPAAEDHSKPKKENS